MDKVIAFQVPVSHIDKPKKFTFPFYYEPHPLSILAAEQVQDYLIENEGVLKHNFGLDGWNEGLVIGKMFGVLVVEKPTGELGFLAAFSGKLADSNDHDYFTPAVFDLLDSSGFFKKEENEINKLNKDIELLENQLDYTQNVKLKAELENTYATHLALLKNQIKKEKEKRKLTRQQLMASNDNSSIDARLEELRQLSLKEQYHLKDFQRAHKTQLSDLESKINAHKALISQLKELRKSRSFSLQNKIFDSYSFLNSKHVKRSLLSIFANSTDSKPPAGAGECAAPKLLQYAFLHQLKPICMAEFWWGASPKSEVRVHKNFYPACRGKCEPILSHMLSEVEMDENPMLQNPAEKLNLEIIFEDDFILAVNKPTEMLSVPGKSISDSVYLRIKQQFPNATGPLIVHRLDMSTSGILLLAKDLDTYKKLQVQFIKRKVEKRYLALLDGVLDEDYGEINLPLRVDLDDRPRQLVCHEHGKPAHTKWEVVQRFKDKTLVYFYPQTGRTHQLRVHAAHPLGLNTSIVGDDLYGKKDKRLCLHAETLIFTHPIFKTRISLQVDIDFLAV